MHVLHSILIYLAIEKLAGQSTNQCLEEYGSWSENTIFKTEYEYLQIAVVRYIKSECRSKFSIIIWKKGNIEVKREYLKKNRPKFSSSLLFHSLSKNDSGNYTFNFSNSKFQYTYSVELIVSDGSQQLKTIRQNTIPQNSIYIVKGQLYWMPRMIEMKKIETVKRYTEFSISCWFCSTDIIVNTSVAWYRAQSLTQKDNKERIQFNSRINTTFSDVSCEFDAWMPKFYGHCYESRLHINPFMSTDTGLYECTVGEYLYTSILVLEEVDNFEPLSPSVSITFNDNETVCAGSTYVLQCRSKFKDNNMSLWFKDSNNNSVILASNCNWDLLYHINSTRLSDTGKYICRQNMDSEEWMFLTVRICGVQSFLYYSYLYVLLIIPIVIVLLIVYFHYLKIRKRFYLSNKIHSITKLNAEGMHRNERYIPLIQDLNWEISRRNVTVSQDILGTGEFGTVYRGKHRNKAVAVKVANVSGNESLMQEINVMKQLGYHQNVIQLIGVCSWNEPLMAIIELADGGNLRQHLRDHNPMLISNCEQIGMEQLLSYVTQIATGMQYLAYKHVIHRDLAARNCLLASDGSIKLSDFGLTRIAVNYYHNDNDQEAKPIAWVAPEAISGNIFTSKSDVWSFGIVMWEVFELGACPYPSMSSSQIIEAVQEGALNRQPSLASDAVYGIMTRCWALQPNDRPSFEDLTVYLDEVDVNEYL